MSRLCERTTACSFGCPVKKTFRGKMYYKVDLYTDKAAAIREENTYSKKGYLTHIMKVPLEQSRDVCWKYALYVRATQTAVGRVIKRGN